MYDLSAENYWTIRARNWKIYWPRRKCTGPEIIKSISIQHYILLLSTKNTVYSRIIDDKWHAIKMISSLSKFREKVILSKFFTGQAGPVNKKILNRMTNRCKTLPCPKLRLRAVINIHEIVIIRIIFTFEHKTYLKTCSIFSNITTSS